jgi:type VI secretion system protein ImpH
MQTTQRRFEPGVIERLFAQPYRFQFFQAVRMLELWLQRNGVSDDGALAGMLRFQNTVSLNFAPSQIEAVQADPREAGHSGAALAEALHDGTLRYIRVTPAFMGFLGVAGTLPAHYTERIATHQIHQRDDGPRAFLDAFSNRALALFYEAWRKYRLELTYQRRGREQVLPLLQALSSQQYPVSAVAIARMLSAWFRRPVEVTQFIGRWYAVPPEQQSALGGDNAVLGATALVGSRVWQRDLRLRLTIGPLDAASYASFLPGGANALALHEKLTSYTGVCLEYEVLLVLRAADVRSARLVPDHGGARLGWDSFVLGGAASPDDRAEVRYDIHAL